VEFVKFLRTRSVPCLRLLCSAYEITSKQMKISYSHNWSGDDIELPRRTPLLHYIRQKNLPMMQWIISHYNISKEYMMQMSTNCSYISPLGYIISGGTIDMVKWVSEYYEFTANDVWPSFRDINVSRNERKLKFMVRYFKFPYQMVSTFMCAQISKISHWSSGPCDYSEAFHWMVEEYSKEWRDAMVADPVLLYRLGNSGGLKDFQLFVRVCRPSYSDLVRKNTNIYDHDYCMIERLMFIDRIDVIAFLIKRYNISLDDLGKAGYPQFGAFIGNIDGDYYLEWLLDYYRSESSSIYYSMISINYRCRR